VFAYANLTGIYRIEKVLEGDVVGHADKLATRVVTGTKVIIDSIGVGAGTLAQAKKLGLDASGFVASQGTNRRDRTDTFGFSNCVTGDTRIAPIGDLRRIYRMRHDGPLYRIKMASGGDFTVTPNHNVLTLGGWVPVHTLNAGDKLVDTRIGDTAESPQIRDVPPTISEVYRAAQEPSSSVGIHVSSRERVDGRGVDFHGDRPVGEVDVITFDSDLDIIYPSGSESFGNVNLMRFLMTQGTLPCLCGALHRRIVADNVSRGPDRHVPFSGTHSAAVFAGRDLRRHQPVRVGVAANGGPSFGQIAADTSLTYSIIGRDLSWTHRRGIL